MLTLTSAGKAAFTAAHVVQEQFTEHVLQDIPDKTQRDLCRRLSLVLRGMIPEPDLAADILAFDARSPEAARR